MTTVRDAENRIMAVIGVGENVSEHRRLQTDFFETRDQLQLAFEAARMVPWSWEIGENRQVLGTTGHARDLVATPGKPVMEGFLDRVHPEDRERVRQAVERTLQDDVPYSVEFRVIGQDGNTRWLACKGRVVRDATGQPLRLVGVSMNNTLLNEAEAALYESQALNREVIANAAEGIVVYDRQLRNVMWNTFMEGLTGYRADEVQGKAATEILPLFVQYDMISHLQRALGGEATKSDEMLWSSARTGRSGWWESKYSPLRNAWGEVVGVIGLINDVSERRQAEEQRARSNAILEATQEAAAEGICLVDDEGMAGAFQPALRADVEHSR
jgi:PAS domain S-box-containing protein